jgi:predicted phosphoribosyltransferase
MNFRDRADAGEQLARRLPEEIRMPTPASDSWLVLAIPRGGVVIGAAVARVLGAPLDLWLSMKIGAPGNPEFAIGAVSVDGEVTLDRPTIAMLGIDRMTLDAAIVRKQAELERRAMAYRGTPDRVEVAGKSVILVDDGIATGATMLSALASLRRCGAARRVVAAPVAPADVMPLLDAAADAVVVLHAPDRFEAVGAFYEAFEAVPDEEVIRLLQAARARG